MIQKLQDWTIYHYAMCIGFAVWCISFAAICWFVFDNWDIEILKTWWDRPPMPVEAAVCFVLIGIAIYMLSLSSLRSHEQRHHEQRRDATKPDSASKHIEPKSEKQ